MSSLRQIYTDNLPWAPGAIRTFGPLLGSPPSLWGVPEDERLTRVSKAAVFQMLGSLRPSFLEKDVNCSTLPRHAFVFRSFRVSSKTSSAVPAAPCQQGLKAHLWGGDPRLCVLAHLCTTDFSMSPLEWVAWGCSGRVCPHSQLIQSKTSLGE